MAINGIPDAFNGDGNHLQAPLNGSGSLDWQAAIRQQAALAQLQVRQQNTQPSFSGSAGMQTPAAPAMNYGQAFNQYATYYNGSNPNFWDKYTSGFSRWAARAVGSDWAQNWVDKTKFKLPVPGVNPTLTERIQSSVSSSQFLGLNASPINAEERLLIDKGWGGYGQYVKNRLLSGQAIKPEAVGGWGEVGRNTLLSNLRGISTALENGRWLSALGSFMGLGLFGLGVCHETWQGYQRARQDELTRGADNWSTLGKTGLSFGKAVVKAGIAWEMGSIGMTVGGILGGPFGGVAGLLGGIAVGALFAVASKCGLDHLDHAWFG